MKTPISDEFREFLKHDNWEDDRAIGHDFFEKTLPDGGDPANARIPVGLDDDEPGTLQGDPVGSAPAERSGVLGGSADQDTGSAAESSA